MDINKREFHLNKLFTYKLSDDNDNPRAWQSFRLKFHRMSRMFSLAKKYILCI